MWRRSLTSMTNGAKRSRNSKENPNPTRTNPVRDGSIPEQEDVIVRGDLVVTAGVGAEWQRPQLDGLEVAVNVSTVVLPHTDGEVDGVGIDSNNRTISLSSHGRRHVRARWRSWRCRWWLR